MEPKKLNKVIHERVRLGIMSALVVRDKVTFNELKQSLDVTDGNLSVHTGILEKHQLLNIQKDFVGKKPQTTFTITNKGRKEFLDYVAEMEKIIEVSRK